MARRHVLPGLIVYTGVFKKLKVRFVIALMAVAVLALFTVNTSRPANAAVNYSWEYTGTNVYNEFGTIFYEFDGLTVGQEYRWDLYTVNPRTGELLQSVDFNTLTPTTVTGTMFFGAPIVGPIGPNDRTRIVDADYQGPVAVVESNGTVLGEHFIASNPAAVADSDWLAAGGNTAVDDKQVIGRFDVNGFCQNPAAAPYNSDGWQHTFRPCSVATLDGDYTILHYQIDTTYVGPSDLRILFFEVGDVTVELTIYIDDILAYQTTDGTACACVYDSFLIVNTSGRLLPFVNHALANEAFVTGDNPMTANFDPGVYNYTRNDAGGWVSDGESVWIVTLDPDQQEWYLDAVDELSLSGQQRLTTRAVTPAIWDNYHGFQQVADVTAGFSDTNVYSFSRNRNFSYTTVGFPATDVTVQWINRAAAINSGLATPEEMEFEVQAFYDIIDTSVPTFEENINIVIGNVGLDNISGRAALMLIILFASILLVSGVLGFGNIFGYLIVWTAVGSAWVIGGFGTPLIDIVYIIMTIGMWVFAVMAAQGNTDEGI